MSVFLCVLLTIVIATFSRPLWSQIGHVVRIGTASHIYSVVDIRDTEGMKRRVHTGDAVHFGEEISTGYDGYAELTYLTQYGFRLHFEKMVHRSSGL